MKRLKLLSTGIATAMLICLPPLPRAVERAAQFAHLAPTGALHP